MMIRILVASWAVAGWVAAQTNRLPEVVVTATRTEEEAFAVPYTAEVVPVAHTRTVPEAFRETPAVMVQKTSHGHGSPFIRGFTGFRTLFLIDGIRLNNSTFRDGPNQYWNTVDPLTVDRLELVKGPSSVLYGSDAIGGTVNALTLSPARAWNGRAYYRGATAENSHTFRFTGGGPGVLGGLSSKSYGDLNDLPRTGYDEWDADAKIEMPLGPDRKLVTAWQYVRQEDVWRTHRTIYARSFHGTAVGTDRELVYDQQRNLAYLQYHGDGAWLSASYQYQGEDLVRVRNNWRRDVSFVDVQTLGLAAQFTADSPLGTWTYGADYYRDWVQSGQTTYNSNGTVNAVAIQGPVADDATYDLLGLYVQDQLTLPARWQLTIGARYTYARADAQKVRDPVTGLQTAIRDDWHNVVGSVRLMWQADQANHWRWFGGVSQGFRAPNLSDLSRLDIARSGEIETAAPGLEPERFIALEAGVKVDYGEFRGEVAYFHTFIRDLIVRAPTGALVNGANEVTKRNAAAGYVHGIEAQGEWWFQPDWKVFGWITWMEGKADAYPTSAPVMQREWLSRVMPLSGIVGLRWEPASGRVWTEVLTSLVARANKLSTADKEDTQRIPPGGTPGYAIASVRAGWRVNNQITLTAACENIFDKEYRIHGSGVNEPRRNLVMTVDVRF